MITWVLYDISDNARRSRIASICLDHGLARFQYSITPFTVTTGTGEASPYYAGEPRQSTDRYQVGYAQHLRDALPNASYNGATGPFKFQQAMGRDGKPAGYDAQQAAIVSVTKGGKYVIEK